MAADPDVTTLTLFGDPVVEEARKRFDRCSEWEAGARSRFLDDVRFANGDSDNGYQWPNAIRRTRDVEARPCLTINIVNQHNLQIVNQALMNRQSIKALAKGSGSSTESASIVQAIFRDIEYQSNAQDDAYKVGMGFATEGGIGWWRLTTAYASDDTFEQEIYINGIQDPLSVYMDPDIQTTTGEDAKFAFVFDNVPKSEFDEAYPKFAGMANQQPLGIGSTDDDWISKDYIRLCEYFRVVRKKDTLISFIDPRDGTRKNIRKSMLKEARLDSLLSTARSLVTRPIMPETVEWKLVAGQEVIDETIWPGKYIPLIRCCIKETRNEGLMDRKGHTRNMKDAQRMYNYNASSQVEFVALQGKTPWVGPLKAIEELEQYWNTANTTNHSYLPYQHVDDENPEKDIPPPQRTQPPNMSPAFQTGMETSFNQLMMASGQWQNSMGMQGNERTGAAISERQEQGDTATFHFQDAFAAAKRYTARQIIQLIPFIYDTKRVKSILADDGSEMEIQMDPAAKQAYMQMVDHQGLVIRRIFNPTMGQYDVAGDVGKSYATKRQEAFEFFKLVLTQSPGLAGLIGDLLFKNSDIDGGQEAAQRLKRMVPPQALGQGPTQQEQKLMAQNQQLGAALAKALQKASKDQVKLVGKDQMRDIDVYKAQTDRFKALSDAFGMDEGAVRGALEELVQEAMQTHLAPILQANQKGLSDESEGEPAPPMPDTGLMPNEAPHPGARMAPDGQWYLADPTRKGKYLRIAPLAQEHQAPTA